MSSASQLLSAPKERTQRQERIRRSILALARERFDKMNQKQLKETSSSSSSAILLAPISPTPVDFICSTLPRLNLTSTSMLLDLGCGDGRWLTQASRLSKCRSVGVDLDADRLALARADIKRQDLDNRIELHQRDILEFMRHSPLLLQADVIIVYLFQEALQEISQILRDRLVSKTVPLSDQTKTNNESKEMAQVQIVSVGFLLPRFTPIWQHMTGGLRVYVYSIPKQL